MLNIVVVNFICGVLICCSRAATVSDKEWKLPVIMWHGLGDTCCNPESMGRVKKIFEEELPGVFVQNIEVGSTVSDDLRNGFLKAINDQVDFVCYNISQNPLFKKGYNSVGFSQGGLFIRALAQKCSTPPAKTMISIGGPQQGIFGFNSCSGPSKLCDFVEKVLTYGAYKWPFQSYVTPAQYWHDPLHEDDYRAKNVFLPDVNQENSVNVEYRENIKRLTKMVLVKFLQDTVVVPKESEWFGFYLPGQSVNLYNLTESDLYKEDKLGLKYLNDQKKLHFETIDAQHLHITDDQMRNLINKYLK